MIVIDHKKGIQFKGSSTDLFLDIMTLFHQSVKDADINAAFITAMESVPEKRIRNVYRENLRRPA